MPTLWLHKVDAAVSTLWDPLRRQQRRPTSHSSKWPWDFGKHEERGHVRQKGGLCLLLGPACRVVITAGLTWEVPGKGTCSPHCLPGTAANVVVTSYVWQTGSWRESKAELLCRIDMRHSARSRTEGKDPVVWISLSLRPLRSASIENGVAYYSGSQASLLIILNTLPCSSKIVFA